LVGACRRRKEDQQSGSELAAEVHVSDRLETEFFDSSEEFPCWVTMSVTRILSIANNLPKATVEPDAKFQFIQADGARQRLQDSGGVDRDK